MCCLYEEFMLLEFNFDLSQNGGFLLKDKPHAQVSLSQIFILIRVRTLFLSKTTLLLFFSQWTKLRNYLKIPSFCVLVFYICSLIYIVYIDYLKTICLKICYICLKICYNIVCFTNSHWFNYLQSHDLIIF